MSNKYFYNVTISAAESENYEMQLHEHCQQPADLTGSFSELSHKSYIRSNSSCFWKANK